MDTYTVYKHISPSGKGYIGLTKNYVKRAYWHKSTSNCRAFKNAIDKYGWNNLVHEVIKENLTLEEACSLEEKLIYEHNTLSPNGYNLKEGGLYGKMSKETIDKFKKRKFSLETREKMSIAHKGKPRSQEAVAKTAAKHTGMKRSEEAKEKMRLAKVGKIVSEASLLNLQKGWEAQSSKSKRFQTGHEQSERCRLSIKEYKQKISSLSGEDREKWIATLSIKARKGVFIDGDCFDSIRSASRITGIERNTIKRRILSEKFYNYRGFA